MTQRLNTPNEQQAFLKSRFLRVKFGENARCYATFHFLTVTQQALSLTRGAQCIGP
jgi:hypothetical protein